MTGTIAFLLIAYINTSPPLFPNVSTELLQVPGIASKEMCDQLAVDLQVPNHKCFAYELAVAWPPAPAPEAAVSAPGRPAAYDPQHTPPGPIESIRSRPGESIGPTSGESIGERPSPEVQRVPAVRDCRELSKRQGQGPCSVTEQPVPIAIPVMTPSAVPAMPPQPPFGSPPARPVAWTKPSAKKVATAVLAVPMFFWSMMTARFCDPYTQVHGAPEPPAILGCGPGRS